MGGSHAAAAARGTVAVGPGRVCLAVEGRGTSVRRDVGAKESPLDHLPVHGVLVQSERSEQGLSRCGPLRVQAGGVGALLLCAHGLIVLLRRVTVRAQIPVQLTDMTVEGQKQHETLIIFITQYVPEGHTGIWSR